MSENWREEGAGNDWRYLHRTGFYIQPISGPGDLAWQWVLFRPAGGRHLSTYNPIATMYHDLDMSKVFEIAESCIRENIASSI